MPDPSNILNWRRLDEEITTSGQPSEDQLSAIQKLGVTHVVNLGPHSHQQALANEPAIVSNLGMDYLNIPVDFDNPTEVDFARFCTAMAELKGRRVHVHCIFNARVTAFFYRFQKVVAGLNEDEARGFMESVWRPGGAWAAFIGDEERIGLPHQYAGMHY